MINSSAENSLFAYSSWNVAIICILVTLLWMLIVIGNLLVLIAISKDYRLKSTQNWFLSSLSVADLLLGLLILPFSLFNEIFGRWIFGRLLCSLWLAIDVLLCTASIMHLCLISIDRYYSIIRPIEYKTSRTPSGVLSMISGAWIISAVICLPPLFGWNSTSFRNFSSPNIYACELTHNSAYVLYSTIGSFYIPLLIIIIIYSQIFIEAKKRANRRFPKFSESHMGRIKGIKMFAIDHNIKISENDSSSIPCNSVIPIYNSNVDDKYELSIIQPTGYDILPGKNIVSKIATRKSKLSRYRERRTIVVLGVVVGAFMLCWLPFFTSYIVVVFCGCMNMPLFGFFFWLGYCNSGLNPIIYTVYNRDFRKAFQKLLSFN